MTKPADFGFDPAQFPDWRDGQWETIERILDWYHRDQTKVLMLQAPTGVGKSLIAGVVARIIGQGHVSPHVIITTTTISLQEQYAQSTLGEDLASVAWGRSNYKCIAFEGLKAHEAPCTVGAKCDVRNICSYYVARDDAHDAAISILNTAFYLTSVNYARLPEIEMQHNGPLYEPTTRFDDAALVIHDEADELERYVRSMVEVWFPDSVVHQLGLTRPPNSKQYGDWEEYIEKVYPLISVRADKYVSTVRSFAQNGELVNDPAGKLCEMLAPRLRFLLNRLLPARPLITLEKGGARFRAVWAADFANQYLWSRARRHLLMSASLHPTYTAKELGLGPDDFEFISLPSPFAPARRKVIYAPKVRMNAKTPEPELLKMVTATDDIIDQNPDKRGIIHAVSYARAAFFKEHSRNSKRMIIHTRNRGGRSIAIEDYLQRQDGPVLVSPSVGRGEDFGAGDGCRFQIFVKYPIPFMGDPIVRARLEEDSDSLWIAADMAFVQAVGRGMRSYDDWCTNYLLDSGAAFRLPRLPEFIQESIVHPQG